VLFTILVVLVGFVISLPVALIPVEYRGARLISWIPVYLSRFFIWLFDIRMVIPDQDLISKHKGLIIANHTSYMDIMILNAQVPLRFMSMAGVRRIPLIGFIASKTGTVFVDRQSKSDRSRALESMKDALHLRQFPPMAIFPEGKVGPGEELLPFKRGAFIASEATDSLILPCVIGFSDLGRVVWGERSMFSSLWYVARSPKDLVVTLLVSLPGSLSEGNESIEMFRNEMQKSLDSIHATSAIKSAS